MRRLIALTFVLAACALPTEPSSRQRDYPPCHEIEGQYTDVVRPLSAADVQTWERVAVVFVHRAAVNGELGQHAQKVASGFDWNATPVAYEKIVWLPYWFQAGSICAAGLTSYPHHIYISTMEPARTGPLVAHETTHWLFFQLGIKDGDYDHTLPYPY